MATLTQSLAEKRKRSRFQVTVRHHQPLEQYHRHHHGTTPVQGTFHLCVKHSLCACQPCGNPLPSQKEHKACSRSSSSSHTSSRGDERQHPDRSSPRRSSSRHAKGSLPIQHSQAVVQAVAKANQAKRVVQSQVEHPSYDGPATPTEGGGVRSGCCGGRLGLQGDLRRLGLSSSYSALDTLQSEAGSHENFPLDIAERNDESGAHPQRVVSECVKSVKSWMLNVGGKVGKGTTALKGALPSLKEDHHVVMVGLDSAGKSTVLYRLKFDQFVNTMPTIGFNCEKVRGSLGGSRGLTFLVWDVGGQEKARPLWRAYTRATDAIIFVVDSCDKERLDEAKFELHRIMMTPDNVGTPILVVANKQDLPEATSPEDLESKLQLSDLRQLHHLEPVCAVTGEGLEEALERLHQLIVKRKKMAKRLRNKTR
eukprot:snap_masked-scaffold809_size94238-processed-gene-0.12 protein:Tk02716 transcript:snap_masked-scaffold809_size94238-processed-gene-0.12-mRNA-1 annotation:"adp-ribosylation factor-like 4a"